MGSPKFGYRQAGAVLNAKAAEDCRTPRRYARLRQVLDCGILCRFRITLLAFISARWFYASLP
jgi:hypothetical protein